MNQLIQWIFYSTIVDPDFEFFIHKIQNNNTTTSCHYQVMFNNVPHCYISMDQARRILYVGETMMELKKACTINRDELEILEEKMIDLKKQDNLKSCDLNGVMEEIQQWIATQLWKIVVQNGILVQELKVLKRYYLIGEGTFFESLIEKSTSMMKFQPTVRTESDFHKGPVRASRNLSMHLEPEEEDAFTKFSFSIPMTNFNIITFDTETVGNLGHRLKKNAHWKTESKVLVVCPVLQLQDETITMDEKTETSTKNIVLGNMQWTSPLEASLPFTCAFGFQIPKSDPFLTSFIIQTKSGDEFEPTLNRISTLHWQLESNAPRSSLLSIEFTQRSFAVHLLSCGTMSEKLELLCSKKLAWYENIVLTGQTQQTPLCVKVAYVNTRDNNNTLPNALECYLNDELLFTCPIDLSKRLDVVTTMGEVYIGLAATSAVGITAWSCSSTTDSKSYDSKSSIANSWKSWSKLGLLYDIPQPADLVITSFALTTYNRLFQTLFPLKRVSWELQDVWSLLMQRDLRTRVDCASFSFLRSKMSFLINSLQFYFQVNIIDVQFRNLMHIVTTSNDIEAVRYAHDNYLATLIKECYVGSKTVREAISRVLRCCFTFCKRVQGYYSSHGISTEYAEKDDLNEIAEEMEKEFTTCSSYLFMVLYKTNARDLVLHLNYNEYFRSTVIGEM